jgi:hypothetical protein
MRSRRRPSAALVTMVCVVLLPACGGSSNSPTPLPSVAPTPPPQVQSVVASGSGPLSPRALALVPFTTTASGTLDVTVDWTLASNDVHVYLMSGSCASVDQFNAGQCVVARFSESTILKPERITLLGATAGPYTLGIGNLGPGEESVSFQVVLTTAGLRGQ